MEKLLILIFKLQVLQLKPLFFYIFTNRNNLFSLNSGRMRNKKLILIKKFYTIFT